MLTGDRAEPGREVGTVLGLDEVYAQQSPADKVASSEAADIVLTTDRLDRLADAMDIARWSRRIAVQSAVVGMTLSLIAMVIAALGWLPPAAGALLQEGIDIAVILNALRALRANPSVEVELPAGSA